MTSIHTSSISFMIDLRRAYCAEYEKSEVLKAEFVEAEHYAAYMLSESSTLIRKMLDHYKATQAEAARQRALRAGLLRARR